jgi:hypothetical protein
VNGNLTADMTRVPRALRHLPKLTAHTVMSQQALESEKLRVRMKDLLLGAGKLWEGLREKARGAGVGG